MNNILTRIQPKGMRSGAGLMDWGRHTRPEMLKKLREYHTRQKEIAEKVLGMGDDDFDVDIVRGPQVQHLVEKL